MKQWLIIITVLTLNITTARAEGIPGERPDMAPSALEKLFGVSLEDKIIEQAKKVEKCRAKWKNIHLSYSDTEGFLWWKHSPKKQALDKLIKQDELLKNFLASTPSDSNKPKYVLIREKGGKGKEANQEVIEINLAMKNLKNVRKQLMIDPENLEKATEYYDAHVTCMVAIIDMHEDFIQNIKTKYVQAIDEVTKEAQSELEKIGNRLQQNFRIARDQRLYEIRKKKYERVLEKLRKARNTILPEQKKWAENRLPLLRETMKTGHMLKRAAQVSKKAKALLKKIGSQFEKLTLSPPPLIDFEIRWSDFELPEPKNSDPNN